MARILVPTDFSKQADYALELAHQLALEINAEIQILHVLDVPEGESFAGMENISFTGESSANTGMNALYFYKLVGKTKERLEKILNRPELKGIKMFEKIQTGSISRQIIEETREGKVDLIIMGTTGTSDWEEELVGSNAEKVVRKASCPVLTVRNQVKLTQIKNIAFASDFKHKDEKQVDLVKKLVKVIGASLHLIKINTPSHFENDKINFEAIHSYARENGLEDYDAHVYNFEDEEDGIISFTE
ncbi:MAG: universal stress protein, partial [Cyclobacteriaceae bacterium]|nr:universal stress protein [Cyclobacteriaceae bacterium]